MLFFCLQQKTAYELRISDWSSDVCSSDLDADVARTDLAAGHFQLARSRHGEFGAGCGQLRDLEVARSGDRRLGRIALDAVGVDRARSGELQLFDLGHGDGDRNLVMIAEAPATPLAADRQRRAVAFRSEEHTSERQSLMRIS